MRHDATSDLISSGFPWRLAQQLSAAFAVGCSSWLISSEPGRQETAHTSYSETRLMFLAPRLCCLGAFWAALIRLWICETRLRIRTVVAVIHATQRMTEMTDIKHWLSAVFKLLMDVAFKCWLTVLRHRFSPGFVRHPAVSEWCQLFSRDGKLWQHWQINERVAEAYVEY